MNRVEVVRAVQQAYRAQDRAGAEALYAEQFVFTSPQDDHIDRAAFFQRCFPTAGRFVEWREVHCAEIGGDDVVMVYEYVLADGNRHRNAEVLTVRDEKLVEAQVFFGGRY